MSDRRRVSSGAPWEERFGYARAIRSGRSLIRSFQTDRKALPPGPDRAGTVTPAGLAASPKWVLVRGESGGNEAVLTTPLDGVPVAAATGSGSSAMSERRTNSFVFLRSCHE